MSTCIFRSALAFRLRTYLETRCLAGRQRTEEIKRLSALDVFFQGKLRPGESITREVVEDYSQAIAHLGPGARMNSIGNFRRFCIYLSHFDRRTCYVYLRAPKRIRRKPYIYSENQICEIMKASEFLQDTHGFRRVWFSTIVGLLYATGLRIGEVRRLTLENVNLKECLLEVRKTKFNKNRYVPISSTTAERLSSYLRQRRIAGYDEQSKSLLFPSSTGNIFKYTTFLGMFTNVLRKLGIRGPVGMPGAHIHDLRHSFAVSRLLAWEKAGENLNAKLPILATYLGHGSLGGTDVYLHTTAEMLQKADARFHEHFAIPYKAY